MLKLSNVYASGSGELVQIVSELIKVVREISRALKCLIELGDPVLLGSLLLILYFLLRDHLFDLVRIFLLQLDDPPFPFVSL
jgi:hypothetical protein